MLKIVISSLKTSTFGRELIVLTIAVVVRSLLVVVALSIKSI